MHSVAILSLDGFGLVGSLPPALGDLPKLTVLALANNPQLTGGLPQELSALPHLLWLSVEGTGIVACTDAGAAGGGLAEPSVGALCSLPASLSYTEQSYNPYGTDSMLCPATVLTSFLAYTSDVSPDLWSVLTSPFPAPPTPGAVIADGNFTRFHACSCSRPGESLVVEQGSGGAACVGSGGGSGGRLGLIIAVVVVGVVPWLLVSLVVYICVVHKATLNRVVRRKEAEMARKRSKVPGTPGVVLQNGRGLLALSDVMVTWVVTDVAASTQLWEWKPDVMDRAIDMHNVALRSLLETFGGHEIRNEGDSFTLSFHDPVDAVTFCIKAQEKLMVVDWPKELAEHPRTSTVTVGDVTSSPEAAGKGPPLIAGLRVRMGINTGLPDDIFLHDLTDHVDYRGLEYDLAGEICDLAEGGQVLMGPRTFLRWNKVNYSALIDPLTADLMRDQQGGSFLAGAGQGGLPHGTSGRRASVTGFGANVGGGMFSLTRDSQQLAMMYGSNIGITGGGGPGGAPPLGLALAPSIRRNSDTHTLPVGGGFGPTFSRLSDGDGSARDSLTSGAPTRHLTPASTFRQGLQDTTLASVDGLAGSVVQGGDSAGSKPASNGLLLPTASGGHGGSHPQLSYPNAATQPGYFAADGGADLLAVAAAGGGGDEYDDRPLVLRLLFGLRELWLRLTGAFRLLLRRCLGWVRILTSSEDDPAGEDIWEQADSTLGPHGDGLGPAGHHRSTAVGSKPQETKGVLVDMGYYRFSATEASEQRPMDHYVHVMQIVPVSVASRVLLFPWPLSLPDGWEKISPGFFDAPGSGRLLFPAMRELLGNDVQSLRPVVTVAFSSVEGFKELSALNVETARQVLAMHNMAVRETLSACSGYECKEFNGNFMATFAMPTDAVEWALTLQLALLAIRWPPALLACEQTALIMHPETNAVLFNGLRCRVGIYAGPIDRVTPHPKTGRADFFGQPVNRAARLMTAAQGGQVVLDQALLDEVLDEWRRKQQERRLATIPSVDEGSPAEEGSLVAASEVRTARSFVSVKSA
ncbi:hypothetical protein GPECTOR_57g519 [Gonium pectorale]|uniref:Guanylate cyclase domain-containing protein n=1 Tax=Gonium pectorale TaxID=33097 RepID=A0A150G5S0_GONPE|nr:hypothetical protein GPECTOR_57g519 [Gonium pectorale]|eukprot:KXZ45229.1 hypothetical protein GPECTOR_57g519 [Gonium pectorale]